MKIRRGNDIRLKIQLPYVDPKDALRANIQVARAFFVNATLKELSENELKKRNRFIGRFPIEPFVNEFLPDKYNINSTGDPIYHAIVANSYKGFGLKPNWRESLPFKKVNLTTYEARVDRTVDSDTIIVTFPAQAQLFDGVYDLIVVSQIYEEGYGNNVRTITSNLNGVFELVSDSEGEDVSKTVQIEITNDNYSLPRNDIYIISGSYSGDTITLNRNDGFEIPVDVSSINGWYVEE